jgi:hypothetical protein
MATSHDRRLDRLEIAVAPKGRTIFVWDNYKPGCVEREIGRLTAAGSLTSHDDLITIGWERRCPRTTIAG